MRLALAMVVGLALAACANAADSGGAGEPSGATTAARSDTAGPSTSVQSDTSGPSVSDRLASDSTKGIGSLATCDLWDGTTVSFRRTITGARIVRSPSYSRGGGFIQDAELVDVEGGGCAIK